MTSSIDWAEFVDQYYEMDPETDDVLTGGEDLEAGMRVLVEDPVQRINITSLQYYIEHDQPHGEILSEARMRNRWCRVTDIVIRDEFVTFVGVYANGVKRQRRHPIDMGWIVKKDSLPQDSDGENEVFFKIAHVVNKAALVGRGLNLEVYDTNEKLDKYVEEILDIVKANNSVFLEKKPTVISGVVDAPEYLKDIITPPIKSLYEEARESVTRWRDWKAQQTVVDAAADPFPTQKAMREANDRLGGPEYYKEIQEAMHAAQEDAIAEVLMGEFEPAVIDEAFTEDDTRQEELVTTLVQNERDKQAKWLEEKARFAETHDSGRQIVDGGYEPRLRTWNGGWVPSQDGKGLVRASSNPDVEFTPTVKPDNPYAEIEKAMLEQWQKDRDEMPAFYERLKKLKEN